MPVLKLMLPLLFAACADGGDNEDNYATTQGNDASLDTDTDADSAEAPTTFRAQVALGETEFAEHCAECHGDMGQGTDRGPVLVGNDAFPLDPPASRTVRTEQFVTVGDIANFVVMNMPADAPGSLPTETYLAILAFDLSANGVTLDQKLTLELADTLTIPR